MVLLHVCTLLIPVLWVRTRANFTIQQRSNWSTGFHACDALPQAQGTGEQGQIATDQDQISAYGSVRRISFDFRCLLSLAGAAVGRIHFTLEIYKDHRVIHRIWPAHRVIHVHRVEVRRESHNTSAISSTKVTSNECVLRIPYLCI